MATLLESAQINKREDLSDLISIADASATVFSTMIPKGAELGNRKFEWQVDSYDTASSASVVDGSDVLFTDTDNTGAAQNYIIDPRKAAARINNHGHYWRRAFRVSPLAAESNAAGYKSEIANGLAKKTIELKRDMEKTLLGTQCAVAGATSTASETRGMGMWTSTIVTSGGTAHGATTFGTNDATYASWTGTPAPFLVPTGSRTTTATGSLTDTIVQDILASIFTKTGTPQGFDLIAGTTLRRAFTNLVVNATTVVNSTLAVSGGNTLSTGTATTGTNEQRKAMHSFEQDAANATFKSTIDVFQGDFGTVRVHASNFMPTVFCGYVVPMDTVQLRYGFMPRVKNLTDNGGGEGRLIEAFAGLVVKNPLNLGRFGATS